MVGTAVYQVGCSLIEPGEEAERVEAAACRPPSAAGGERARAPPPISPWMWNSGMTFRQRSAGVERERRADVAAEAARFGVAERHDLGPRGRARGVQHQRDVVGLRPARRRPVRRPHRGRRSSNTPAGAPRRHASSRTGMPCRSRDRARGPLVGARLDDQRLGAEVGQIELELVGAIGGIERGGGRAGRDRRRRRSPSRGRSASTIATGSPRPMPGAVQRRRSWPRPAGAGRHR